jgi:hypothetical protein
MSDVFVGDNDHGDTPLPPLSDLLWAEVTKLRQDKVRLEEDIVHFANELNEVTNQRDEARRELCNWSVGVGVKATSQAVAEERGWDCFKSVTESYEKIATKYHATLEKLAQDENANEEC